MNWKIRPDCTEKGCTSEQAVGRDWCRDHDPERCQATVSPNTHTHGNERCRNRAWKGLDFCKKHQALIR